MEKASVRVRFAPSPTGALHIGGIRTALYNYLFARQHKGVFILRIEDTDQQRYVEGAEAYISEALTWCGLVPDESPEAGGPFGPYRQSERMGIYRQYADQLVDSGHAYYAFDTAESLEQARGLATEGNFKYDASNRLQMDNSLSQGMETALARIEAGEPYVIRLKVPASETVDFEDLVRGSVSFQTAELDDKVLIKSDGMPTYHMANVVDDHLMQISHVIRGEEWLPSTAHHLLLYRFLGWEERMPVFAHLPLILKPNGQGKLSKRDGLKLGIPVFPLSWEQGPKEDHFQGFREAGFLPAAVLNFLALLGWHPGSEEEILSLQDMVRDFSLEKISKGGARFDFDKARWFNHKYIQQTETADLLPIAKAVGGREGILVPEEYLSKVITCLKDRLHTVNEIFVEGSYFFQDPPAYDEANLRKRWKERSRSQVSGLFGRILSLEREDSSAIESEIQGYLAEEHISPGEIMPILRIILTGAMKGPAVHEMMAILGKERLSNRFSTALARFEQDFGLK